MNNGRPHISLYLILSFVAIVYVVLRIFKVPMTTDETWTLYSYAKGPLWQTLTAAVPASNNHILNSVLTRITTSFSIQEFYVRLPNLLGLLIYIYASYRLSGQMMNNAYLQLMLFTVLLANHTLLAFFGLCRGYGLSIGLLMLSLTFLLQYAKHKQQANNRHLHVSLFFAAMALYASFSLLYIVAAIFIIAFVLNLRPNHQQRLKHLWTAARIPLLYGVLILCTCAYPLYRMYDKEELYYGGRNNFIDDSLYSLLCDFAGNGYMKAHRDIVMTIVIIFILLSIGFSIYHFVKNKTSRWYIIPSGITIASIVVINIMFYSLKISLPLDRTSLYLYPLLVITIFTIPGMLYDKNKIISLVLAFVITLFSMYRLANEVNLHSIDTWWHDRYTIEVLEKIIEDNKDTGKKVSIAASKSVFNSLNYHASSDYPSSFYKMEYEAMQMPDTFNYIYTEHNDRLEQLPYIKVLNRYADGHFVLYKNISGDLAK